MASSSQDGGRNPFRDITNISTAESGLHTDSTELKRRRAREQYANMPVDQKNEILKRRRQSYQENKMKSSHDRANHEQSVEVGSSRSQLPGLDTTPSSQGGHSVVFQASLAFNQENMPPQSPENLNIELECHNTVNVPELSSSMTQSPRRTNDVKLHSFWCQTTLQNFRLRTAFELSV